MSAISKAVEKAGSQAELARLLGVSSQAVNKMLAAKRVPAERVLKIEEVTGVSRHELRPDLYPAESAA
ncbi:MAG: YdaS family helix-turn-helix protein [Pseudomonas sp.]|jgi:DNA-binding transcriptional regulator YdaS (Cro superfamily)|uniref:transcriptional regulator n=1 Tax=Pseudomonas sp. TaxID=306 RepID=UPI003241DD52|tara:strand:+ start:337 stop:540 length:204 start_codon:yes stop_codon:yes gene_type:complete